MQILIKLWQLQHNHSNFDPPTSPKRFEQQGISEKSQHIVISTSVTSSFTRHYSFLDWLIDWVIVYLYSPAFRIGKAQDSAVQIQGAIFWLAIPKYAREFGPKREVPVMYILGITILFNESKHLISTAGSAGLRLPYCFAIWSKSKKLSHKKGCRGSCG